MSNLAPPAIQPKLLRILHRAFVQAEPFHVPVSEPLSLESLCNGFITVLWLISLTSLMQIMDKVAGLAAAVALPH